MGEGISRRGPTASAMVCHKKDLRRTSSSLRAWFHILPLPAVLSTMWLLGDAAEGADA